MEPGALVISTDKGGSMSLALDVDPRLVQDFLSEGSRYFNGLVICSSTLKFRPRGRTWRSFWVSVSDKRGDGIEEISKYVPLCGVLFTTRGELI